MRQVTKKGLITVAAAGGVLAMTGGYAYADSTADGRATNSSGILSGNSVQVPVHIPVNVCGNTIHVIGLLNPAFGTHCSNNSSSASGKKDQGGDGGGYGGSRSDGGATAVGRTGGSLGVLSGNDVEIPVHVPVNACGDSVTIGGLGNVAHGNDCANDSTTPVLVPHQPKAPQHHAPRTPSKPVVSPNAPVIHSASAPKVEQLAETGAGGLGLIIPASAGLLFGGAVLYRRSRAAA